MTDANVYRNANGDAIRIVGEYACPHEDGMYEDGTDCEWCGGTGSMLVVEPIARKMKRFTVVWRHTGWRVMDTANCTFHTAKMADKEKAQRIADRMNERLTKNEGGDKE